MKMSRNHWRYRLMDYCFTDYPKYFETHYCPLFHLTNLLALLLPVIIVFKLIGYYWDKYLEQKASNMCDMWFEYLEKRSRYNYCNKRLIYELKSLNSFEMNSRIIAMLDTLNLTEDKVKALWNKLHNKDQQWLLAVKIGSIITKVLTFLFMLFVGIVVIFVSAMIISLWQFFLVVVLIILIVLTIGYFLLIRIDRLSEDNHPIVTIPKFILRSIGKSLNSYYYIMKQFVLDVYENNCPKIELED